MRRLPLVLALAAILVPLALLALPGTALAHDCSSPSDCEETAGYNAVVAVIGGLIAIIVGIFSSSLGAAIGAVPVTPLEPATGAPVEDPAEPGPMMQAKLAALIAQASADKATIEQLTGQLSGSALLARQCQTMIDNQNGTITALETQIVELTAERDG